MDIDKLTLKPSEIDKNTGRIVLPKSQEELDRLSGKVIGNVRVQTRMTSYQPTGQRPSFPQPGSMPHPVAPANPTLPTDIRREVAFWKHPFYGILGFCTLVAAVPLSFFCASLMKENDQLTREVDRLETRTAVLEASKSSITTEEALRLAALQQEMSQMKTDVAQLSNAGIEVYLEEEALPVEIETGDGDLDSSELPQESPRDEDS